MNIRDYKNLSELDEGNPLLKKIPPEMSFEEWDKKLFDDPRKKWAKPYSMPPLESNVDAIFDLFIPTQTSISVVLALHNMIRVSLRRRDPRLHENRRRIYQRSEHLDRQTIEMDLGQLANFSIKAMGMMLLGPTGVSKTHTIDNYLAHLPQFVPHGKNEECGWDYLMQLVYLRVQLPNDARESSLYHNIADAIDKVLGTSYGVEIRRPRTKVPDKLNKILAWLNLHRCGVLILEELQEKQTSSEVLGKEFAGAFLQFTNEGIPLVVIGNPLAFEHILDFTQDVGRLSSSGKFEMAPAYDHTDDTWCHELVPGIWGWKCFNEKDEPIADLEQILYERTGGIPKFLSIYRSATLKEAIRAGATRVRREHVDNAYFSAEMIGLHHIIEAYVSKDPHLFAKMRDQPLVFLQRVWAREKTKRDWLSRQKNVARRNAGAGKEGN
ncbi:ATP-binding protein [Variovorax sp. HJSM1_2]|uniref:ATP-binding protein n=1 Tax=Variovorax sp. HJSM1_2 TaxID=3366263 RepID=UPI003BC97D6B